MRWLPSRKDKVIAGSARQVQQYARVLLDAMVYLYFELGLLAPFLGTKGA